MELINPFMLTMFTFPLEILTEIQARDKMESEILASVKVEIPEAYVDFVQVKIKSKSNVT